MTHQKRKNYKTEATCGGFCSRKCTTAKRRNSNARGDRWKPFWISKFRKEDGKNNSKGENTKKLLNRNSNKSRPTTCKWKIDKKKSQPPSPNHPIAVSMKARPASKKNSPKPGRLTKTAMAISLSCRSCRPSTKYPRIPQTSLCPTAHPTRKALNQKILTTTLLEIFHYWIWAHSSKTRRSKRKGWKARTLQKEMKNKGKISIQGLMNNFLYPDQDSTQTFVKFSATSTRNSKPKIDNWKRNWRRIKRPYLFLSGQSDPMRSWTSSGCKPRRFCMGIQWSRTKVGGSVPQRRKGKSWCCRSWSWGTSR